MCEKLSCNNNNPVSSAIRVALIICFIIEIVPKDGVKGKLAIGDPFPPRSGSIR